MIHPHHWIHRYVETFYTPYSFFLCVDDFGVKNYSRNDAEHLLNTLGKSYEYTVDWDGANFCGLTLNWNYEKGYVDVSMSEYVRNALQRLRHTPKVSSKYSPHPYTPIVYRKKAHDNMQQTQTLLRYYHLQRRNIPSLLLDTSFIMLEHWMEPCSLHSMTLVVNNLILHKRQAHMLNN